MSPASLYPAFLAWIAIAASLVLTILGPLLDLSDAVLGVSPFRHIPDILGGEFEVQPMLILFLIAGLLTLAGLGGIRRRDVQWAGPLSSLRLRTRRARRYGGAAGPPRREGAETRMQLTDRRFFGLLGEVVDGNPTQEMMAAAFAAADLPWSYISIPVPRGSFDEAFEATRQLGFTGLHITKPYKIDAVAVVDDLSPAAANIGAVNCVYQQGDRLVGDNTDGRGLVNALTGASSVEGASVVVLGAGGASRAIAVELGLAGVREVTVVNRTEAVGRSLVDALRMAVDAECRFVPWDGGFTVPPGVDVVVNGTSIGMVDPDERPDVSFAQLRPEAVVADAVIAPRDTAFLADAAGRGLRTVTGAEMLVQQAAISFDLWTGRVADETALRSALHESLLMP